MPTNDCSNCSNYDAVPEGCDTDGELCQTDEFECHIPIINNVKENEQLVVQEEEV